MAHNGGAINAVIVVGIVGVDIPDGKSIVKGTYPVSRKIDLGQW
jgi:hypothetical protein